MRALIISNMYPGKNAYYGIFIKNQIDALDEIGIKIKAVVKSDRSLYSWVTFILKTIWAVAFSQYDIVHAHYGFHSAIVPSIIKRKPLIITFHGSDALQEPFRNALYMWLQKWCIKRANYLIAVSRDIRNNLVSKLEAKESVISVVPCGIDTTKFCPIDRSYARRQVGLETSTKTVLYVGQLHYMKGVDIIYNCAARMPNVEFVLIGEGNLSTDLRNCRLIGAVSNKDIPLWINACDAFILPSRSEGTPMVVLEAISCGVQVVCSDVGGCADLINDCKAGLLLRLRSLRESRNTDDACVANNSTKATLDAVQLKLKLNSILSIPENKNSRDKVGRNLVVEKFDRIVVAKKIEKIYKEACNINNESFIFLN
jgi:glycosyltransferase involved in cell wall biosynthesis